jgi:hypothetical protein
LQNGFHSERSEEPRSGVAIGARSSESERDSSLRSVESPACSAGVSPALHRRDDNFNFHYYRSAASPSPLGMRSPYGIQTWWQAAKHFPAVLVDLFLSRTRTVFGKQSVGRFLRLDRLSGRLGENFISASRTNASGERPLACAAALRRASSRGSSGKVMLIERCSPSLCLFIILREMRLLSTTALVLSPGRRRAGS